MKAKLNRAYLIPAAVFIGGGLLYLSTLAPGLVFGDPSEYTLAPHLWAILHPPGYAFMTLLVKLWQTIVPIGTLAYRTNLLSAFAGAATGVMVFGAVRALPHPPAPSPEGKQHPSEEGETASGQLLPPLLTSVFGSSGEGGWGGEAAALFAAFSLYTASNFWQHSIHTNAHIVTALLASASIFLLLRWRATTEDRWLYAFGLIAGLSVTHHPLLAFGFPAYAVFVLTNRPRWRTLLVTALFGVMGLAPWLYFPIRSSIQPPPPFGPGNMNTLDGFLDLVLARGLTGVNLFHFGLDQQWHRLIVFWSLIQLQFTWPVILLAIAGLFWLARRDWPAALLLGLHVLVNLIFTLNSVQDVMAYLLTPLVSIAVCIGAGALAMGEWLAKLENRIGGRRDSSLTLGMTYSRWITLALLLFPLANAVWLAPRISLREWREADAYVDSVFAHFAGKGEHAVLLSDWEHATPLWYRQYVDGQTLDPADVTVVYVNKPFVDAVWENIDKGPIYLIEYNRDIVNTGFRLRAEGDFYRLQPPPAVQPPTISHPLDLKFGPVELLGYDLLTDSVEPGGVIPLILYLRAPELTDHIIQPFARLGAWEHRFTTDSRLLTPYWQAGEIIAERWEVIVPLDAPPGAYPLEVGLSDLTTGEDLGKRVNLGSVQVGGNGGKKGNGGLAANFGQRVGVESVEGWGGGSPVQSAPWAEPITVRAGESVELRIKWRALASVENSYTVFVHLLDSGNGLIASQDYTPLGGAWPTMLWFPKWLPGQSAVDPYRLTIPPDAPPGDYVIEIGLYGLRSVVRVPAFDADGNLAGDRFVVGGVRVIMK